MDRTRAVIPALLVAALAGFAVPAVLAQPAAADRQVEQAELTTEQATTIAEAMGKGRATRVKLDRNGSQLAYKIKVHSPDAGTVKLKIAAEGGQVLSIEREDEEH